MKGRIVSLSRSGRHTFSKDAAASLTLIAGHGVEGDAHAGSTVKHRSRVARDPSQPNLRQVHLIHAELLAELQSKGFPIAPGMLGENVTTSGIDLLRLPVGTALHLGADAVVELTGLRNPCSQIEDFHEGLLSAVVDKDAAGRAHRKTGVMAIVRVGGVVRAGDEVRVELPAPPHRALEVV
ncbi:MAG TPA: MOSC domain-containing protein [Vicinamibacterales bacterium]|nr:MOSC domain-containing protein [Vicinamibacterales bacterium]